MNYRLLSRMLGVMCLGLSATMIPAVVCALVYKEWKAAEALGFSMASIALVAGALYFFGRRAVTKFFQKEALAIVSGTWLMASVLGALPFVFNGDLGLVDAIFETSSGFSTTGSSVMINIEGTAKGILFWRSFTHWLGGAGIVVLFIAVLPYLGAGGKLLFKSESSGPNKAGFTPRIKDTATIVWAIYCGLTALQTIALMVAGMHLFDALCHTFGTLSSGGFSTRQMSIMAYDNVAIEVITIVFMICAGTSFGTFFLMVKGDWLAPLKDTEWRIFFGLLAGFTLLVTFNLTGMVGTFEGVNGAAPVGFQYNHFPTALRHAAFQVVSMMTNTGFISTDFDRWPEFSRLLLVCIMFLGGCAGSTTAGLKIIRVIVLVKAVYAKLVSTFRPKMVRVIRISGTVVGDEAVNSVFCFAAILVAWFVVGSMCLTLMGVPLVTSLSAVACTLNGTGPGLEHVGAIMDFHTIPALGKLLLSLSMVMGRLEMFTLFVLLAPPFWSKD